MAVKKSKKAKKKTAVVIVNQRTVLFLEPLTMKDAIGISLQMMGVCDEKGS